MKVKPLICLCIFAYFFTKHSLKAQSISDVSLAITPGEMFDHIYDKDGNSYPLSLLQVKLNSQNGYLNVSSTTTCQAGFFKVYFANGSGMEQASNPTHTSRRNTICHVLENISGLLGWANWTSTTSVNILVDDINIHEPNAANSSVLGLASAYYAFPASPTSANPGVIQNQIQKTIISQYDAWNNIVPPMTAQGGANFYHGFITLNFSNTSYTWQASPATNTASPTEFDMYTIALHELTHALGFVSLIGPAGISKFGANNNYYSTYDLFLKDYNQNLLLTSLGCSYQYGLSFTSNTVNLAPACTNTYLTNNTTCSTSCLYNSVNLNNISVYTPNCFEPASSLSHFEDMCYPTNTPSNNDMYFVMSNGTGQGINKRFLKEEERYVLCDLGYSVNTTYTSSAIGAPHTYSGGGCTGKTIWGQNDGISTTAYTYTSTGSSFTVPISGSGGILFNDASSAVSATCIETVYNNGTVSVNGNIITFTPAANFSGPVLLRYIPLNSNGDQGNVTYIFGYVFPGSCSITSVCDMVTNGGFENRSGCGSLTLTASPTCWFPYNLTPDFFVRNCTSYTPAANLGLSTFSASPPFDSHNPSNNNDVVVGLGGYATPGFIANESINSYLSSPLIPGQSYNLSFWAYQYTGVKVDPLTGNPTQTASMNPASVPLVFTIGVSDQPVGSFGTFPNASMDIINTNTLSSFNTWKYYNSTFTFTPSSSNPGNLIYAGIDSYLTLTNVIGASVFTSTPPVYQFYMLLDDISIKPSGQAVSFVLPTSTLCTSQGFTDLAQYVSVPGGTFSGTGVSTVITSGLQYEFNSAGNLTPGLYTIAYTYTDNLACVQTVYQQVQVQYLNALSPSFINPGCSSNAGVLSVSSATPGYSFTWQPGGATGSTVAITPTATTVYTVTGTKSGACSLQGTVAATPYIPTLTISTSPGTVCASSTINVNASGNYTAISWQPGSINTNSFIITPTVPLSYTATVTNQFGCSITQTFAVPVFTNCCPAYTQAAIFTNTSIVATTTLSSSQVILNNITVQTGQALYLTGSEFVFAPGTKIIVNPGAVLSISASHLYACNSYMWQGIELKDGGYMKCGANSLVEDAITAIDASNTATSVINPILEVNQTTFNKNFVDISIGGYQQSANPYPFAIDKCIFTCRSLTFTQSAWPQTGTTNTNSSTSADLRALFNSTTGLAPPYLGQSSFTVTTLKNPYSSQSSSIAILLYKVGVTTYTSNNYNGAVFKGIQIGDANSFSSFNVFDSHATFIHATNSNVYSYNNVFQNTTGYGADGAGSAIYSQVSGANGLNANFNNVLDLNPVLNYDRELANRFWNCHIGIHAINNYSIDVGWALMRSTQNTGNGINNYLPGFRGVLCNTNRFGKYDLYDIDFNNICNPIGVFIAPGTYKKGSLTAQYGILAGDILVTNCFMGASTNTSTSLSAGTGSLYLNQAVQVKAILGSTWDFFGGNGVYVGNNEIDRAFSGVNFSGLGGSPNQASSNRIRLLDNNVSPGSQRGVKVTNSLNSIVVTNTVLGPSTNNNINVNLVRSGFNGSPRIRCNVLENGYRGFVFEGPNSGTFWRGNTMKNHSAGMVLSNTAVIGQQGTTGSPSDNKWLGTNWSSSNYGLLTESGADAQFSKLYVKNSGAYAPANVASFPAFLNYASAGNLIATTGTYVCEGSGSVPGSYPDNVAVPMDGDFPNDGANFNVLYNIYRYMHFNDTLGDNIQELQDLYESLAESNVAALVQVEDLFYQGEIGDAITLNENLSPQTTMEQNCQDFFTLYGHFADEYFTDIDSAALYSLASLCPGENGACVYMARNLYGWLYAGLGNFPDECSSTGSRKAAPANNGRLKNRWQAAIFPNPTNGRISIRSGKESELLNVVVQDVSGRTVLVKELLSKDFIANLEMELVNGLYLITVTNATNERTTKKLVVSK